MTLGNGGGNTLLPQARLLNSHPRGKDKRVKRYKGERCFICDEPIASVVAEIFGLEALFYAGVAVGVYLTLACGFLALAFRS